MGPSRPSSERAIIGLDPLTLLVRIAGFVVAISVHEFFHAFTAWRLGDNTAKNAGRLTLNPLRHLDPFGSILLLVAGFGWGKPVPVDPRNLRHGRMGMAMVSAAGPASNFCVALLTAVAAQLLLNRDVDVSPLWVSFLRSLVVLNVGLCAFNLIPIPPLDGFGVAVGVLPWSIARPLARLAQYGPGILMLLVFSAYIIHIDLLGLILSPFVTVLIAAIRAVAQVV